VRVRKSVLPVLQAWGTRVCCPRQRPFPKEMLPVRRPAKPSNMSSMSAEAGIEQHRFCDRPQQKGRHRRLFDIFIELEASLKGQRARQCNLEQVQQDRFCLPAQQASLRSTVAARPRPCHLVRARHSLAASPFRRPVPDP